MSLIKCLTDYIIKENSQSIKKKDLSLYASKNFYKGKNVHPLKFTNELLEKIVLEINKKSSIKYELNNSTIMKKNVIDEYVSSLEMITNPSIVLELIKSILLTEINLKSNYTIYEIKQYFYNNYHKNPGNLITRELLINVCLDLYNEEKKYYFVDGDGNALQVWKANSIQEWQNFGLGTVYNPIVKVKNEEFNVQDFTLYVYESVNSVCSGNSKVHEIENVTIYTTNIFGYSVAFNAYYCHECNKYFTSKSAIENIFPQKDYPFIKIKLLFTNSTELQSETILHIYGYTVKADGPSDSQRENLLAKLLTYEIVTKKEVEGLLWHLIHYNGKKKNMDSAKAKWKNDLQYVRNFNLSKQSWIKAKRLKLR